MKRSWDKSPFQVFSPPPSPLSAEVIFSSHVVLHLSWEGVLHFTLSKVSTVLRAKNQGGGSVER